jgi:hypothetical protein
MHEPRYVLRDGIVVHTGSFYGAIASRDMGTRLLNQARKSALFRRIERIEDRLMTRRRTALFAALVEESRRLLQREWPCMRFVVVMWDNDDAEGSRATDALKGLGIEVHRVSRIIPDYVANGQEYRLSVHDRHPNRLAYQLVGAYVLRSIVGPTAGEPHETP